MLDVARKEQCENKSQRPTYHHCYIRRVNMCNGDHQPHHYSDSCQYTVGVISNPLSHSIQQYLFHSDTGNGLSDWVFWLSDASQQKIHQKCNTKNIYIYKKNKKNPKYNSCPELFEYVYFISVWVQFSTKRLEVWFWQCCALTLICIFLTQIQLLIWTFDKGLTHHSESIQCQLAVSCL